MSEGAKISPPYALYCFVSSFSSTHSIRLFFLFFVLHMDTLLRVYIYSIEFTPLSMCLSVTLFRTMLFSLQNLHQGSSGIISMYKFFFSPSLSFSMHMLFCCTDAHAMPCVQTSSSLSSSLLSPSLLLYFSSRSFLAHHFFDRTCSFFPIVPIFLSSYLLPHIGLLFSSFLAAVPRPRPSTPCSLVGLSLYLSFTQRGRSLAFSLLLDGTLVYTTLFFTPSPGPLVRMRFGGGCMRFSAPSFGVCPLAFAPSIRGIRSRGVATVAAWSEPRIARPLLR